MFTITVLNLDRYSKDDKKDDDKAPRSLFGLTKEKYEKIVSTIINNIKSKNPDLIKGYISSYSKPLEVFKKWNWEKEIKIGLIIEQQNIYNESTVINNVFFKNWNDYEKNIDLLWKPTVEEPGFFSSAKIVIYM
jgi:hypothetical protein